MKIIQKTIYVCEHCGLEFKNEKDCKNHEMTYHICPNCKHHFYLFGAELACDCSKCTFEPKE